MDIDFNAIMNTITVFILGIIAAWIRKFFIRTNVRIDSWDSSVKKIDKHLNDHDLAKRQLNRIEEKVDESRQFAETTRDDAK